MDRPVEANLDVTGSEPIPESQVGEPVPPKWTESHAGPWSVFLTIVVCVVCGYVFVLPGLHNRWLMWGLYISVGVCAVASVALLLLLLNVDPGIIRPSDVKDPDVARAEAGDVSEELSRDEKGQWQRTRPGGSSSSSRVTVERYCATCHIWRPPRSSHCPACGYCMERFDHHCAAVAVCIARKNHRFFVLLLAFVSSGAGLLLAGVIVRFTERPWSHSEPWHRWHTYVLGFLAFVYVYLSLLSVFALVHCGIIACDLTTSQFIKDKRSAQKKKFELPSCRAWWENVKGVCCAEVRHKRKAGRAQYELANDRSQMLDTF